MNENFYPSCPRCESFDVGKARPFYLVAVGLSLSGLGAWLLAVPVVGVVFLASGGLTLLLAPFTRGLYYCRECRKLWKYRKAAPRHKGKILRFPGQFK